MSKLYPNNFLKNENNDNTAINDKWVFLLSLAPSHKKVVDFLDSEVNEFDLSEISRSFILLFQVFDCIYRTSCFHTPKQKCMV